jgi:putative endonuclease
MHSTRELGRKYEDMAVDYLKGQGFKIIERSYSCPMGEIDIIAYEGRTLSFIEVRARSRTDFGTPAETVNKAKQNKIVKTALNYIKNKNIKPQKLRFDVISIVPHQEPVFIRNAFSSSKYFY